MDLLNASRRLQSCEHSSLSSYCHGHPRHGETLGDSLWNDDGPVDTAWSSWYGMAGPIVMEKLL